MNNSKKSKGRRFSGFKPKFIEKWDSMQRQMLHIMKPVIFVNISYYPYGETGCCFVLKFIKKLMPKNGLFQLFPPYPMRFGTRPTKLSYF